MCDEVGRGGVMEGGGRRGGEGNEHCGVDLIEKECIMVLHWVGRCGNA